MGQRLQTEESSGDKSGIWSAGRLQGFLWISRWEEAGRLGRESNMTGNKPDIAIKLRLTMASNADTFSHH